MSFVDNKPNGNQISVLGLYAKGLEEMNLCPSCARIQVLESLSEQDISLAEQRNLDFVRQHVASRNGTRI